MKRLLLLAVLAPSFANAQPTPITPKKVKVKDLVQPMKIEKIRPAKDVGDELAAAMRTHDVKATTELLRDRFFMRGMWFPDAACAKRFAKERVIEKAERTAFAKCLAKLEPQISTRKSADGAGYVLTFVPGVEIELGISNEIYYVGMLHAKSRRDVPTLSTTTFEALRKAGSTNVDAAVATQLDPELKRRTQAAAWLEVCVDAKGALTVEVSEATTPAIGEIFKAATKDWAFSAFTHNKKPIAACTQTLLTYPASKAPLAEVLPSWVLSMPPDEGVEGGVEGGEVGGEWTPGVGFDAGPPPPPPPPPPAPPQNVPPTLLEGSRIAGEKAIVPSDMTKVEIARSGKDKIVGSFKLCVDPTGKVSNVLRLKSTGFEAYDTKILTEMRTNWAYRPYLVNGKAVPVCTAVTFIYTQVAPTPPPKKP